MKTAIPKLSLASALMFSPLGMLPAVQSPTHVETMLHSVNNSSVEGFVDLQQLPKGQTGSKITLLAFGLNPGGKYVSLYYGNHACNLEPYSADDVIGGIYTANFVGVGLTHGTATDNLSEINSVSVRDANTFNLLACADIHPYH